MIYGDDVGTPRVGYEDGMCFLMVCPKCHRFVKPDETVRVDVRGQPAAENAECKQHGRVYMPFEGYY